MQKQTSYYDILKISPQASDEDVKQAFRQLAMIYHPDRNPRNPRMAETRFRLIQEAYAALKTQEKRRHYNHTLNPQNDNRPFLAHLADLFRPLRKGH